MKNMILCTLLSLTLFAEESIIRVAPGSDVACTLQISLPPDTHTYWKNPGDSGVAASFHIEGPQGLAIKDVIWPTPSQYEIEGITVYGYSNNVSWDVLLHCDLEVGTYTASIIVDYVLCGQSCIPCSMSLPISLHIEENGHYTHANTPQRLKISSQLTETKLSMTLPYAEHVSHLSFFSEQQYAFETNSQISWHQDNKGLHIDIPLSPRSHTIIAAGSSHQALLVIQSDRGQEAVPIEITLPSSYLWILAMAWLGGLLLNITPCVLPVIGIKVVQLLTLRSSKKIWAHSVAFAAGVQAFFLALGGAMIALRASGHLLGWGFHVQEPTYIAALFFIILLCAYSMFGFWHVGMSLSSYAAEAAPTTSSYTTSFATGLLSTAIATPCTGPLLGATLGFLTLAEPSQQLTILSMMGLGLASPFLLIGCAPQLARFIPKPGAWLETMKQALGFGLLATCIWLLWVLEQQQPRVSASMVACIVTTTFFSVWAYTYSQSVVSWKQQVTRGVSLITICISIGLLAYMSNDTVYTYVSNRMHASPKEIFSEEALKHSLAAGNIVLVDISASWCLSCQANHIVMQSKEVQDFFHRHHIRVLHADWTHRDDTITALLHTYGRNGVPTSILYIPGKRPLVLRELLSQEYLMTTIHENL